MVNVSSAKQVINLFVHNPAQRLIQKPKVVQMAVENLSKLRYTPACDTFVSTTPKLTSKIAPLKKYGYGWGGFAKTTDGKYIGEFKCVVHEPYNIVTAGQYPLSWINKETGLPKPSLYIDYMSTSHAEHQGYGREMMKRFYLQSVESGCEGRISLRSAWGSDGFYNKLGFELGESKMREMKNSLARAERELKFFKKSKSEGCDMWDDEISRLEEEIIDLKKDLQNPVMAHSGKWSQDLFFTPTPENVAKLFSK